jgi:DNA-binding response OmpR family regulator
MALSATPHEIRKMELRIEKLEEENAWLRSELGLTASVETEVAIRKAFSLTPTDSRILAIFYSAPAGRLFTKEQIDDFVGIYSQRPDHKVGVVDVFIYRIRQVLGFNAIENVWARGYRLTACGRDTINQAIGIV